MAQVRWTPAQTRQALFLYFQMPFGRLHKGAPEIIALAQRLGRTQDAVAMKLGNLASLDPKIIGSGRRGLSGASNLDRQVFARFCGDWDGLIAELVPPSDQDIAYTQEHVPPSNFAVRDTLPIVGSSKMDSREFDMTHLVRGDTYVARLPSGRLLDGSTATSTQFVLSASNLKHITMPMSSIASLVSSRSFAVLGMSASGRVSSRSDCG